MKFLLTRELGRLAKWLRICGFDAVYCTESKAGAIIIAALKDGRTILTRNRRMPLGRGVPVVQIDAEKVQDQLVEICQSLGIRPAPAELFSRCTVCNRPLRLIDKARVKDAVPAYVFETQARFFQCPGCERVYWQGTHWEQVLKALRCIKEYNE